MEKSLPAQEKICSLLRIHTLQKPTLAKHSTNAPLLQVGWAKIQLFIKVRTGRVDV
jgi:hypothetical protein